MNGLELWGGHEYTVNRVGNLHLDQTVRSGHQDRIDDLDLFADIGFSALRYPVLWERVAPVSLKECDWTWTDKRLERIHHLGMAPIAGLVHHGSGPRYATLDTSAFAEGLAAFAGLAARRYPWIENWTPVNEPLTTARFSALYGHWYPHVQAEHLFWQVLLNQIDGVRLAIREIRKAIPAARLVQTEDLGCTYSTPGTADQAAFDNARRWMTWDLLCGRVTHDHPLWLRLVRMGFGPRLQAIADDPCPPDIIGINHYLTSDRFLDDRAELYPEANRGGNRYIRFADVEAVRVMQPAPAGLRGALHDAWTRYGRPLAVTEVHNGCTREEQLRWMAEAWETAMQMRAEGADIRAVTAWSLLGAYDWDSLLTRQQDHYEPGVFDIRGGTPRPTALVSLLKSLKGCAPAPEGWQGAGWWRRDIRLTHSPVRSWSNGDPPKRSMRGWRRSAGPLLIVGATGTLGRMFARVCEWRDLDYVLASRHDFCIGDNESARRFIDACRPRAVVNAAGWVRVDEAEHYVEPCMLANAEGAVRLAAVCAETRLPFVTFSSDLVFDGAKGSAYVETDTCNPISVYGASKRAAEEAILKLDARALIVRTAAFFSPHDPHNFAAAVVRELGAQRTFEAADDLIVSPTFVPDLANVVLDLLIDGEVGLWHVANRGETSWAGFAHMIGAAMSLDTNLIVPRRAESFGWAARRPAASALNSERGILLPGLDDAVARYADWSPKRTQHAFPSEHWQEKFVAGG